MPEQRSYSVDFFCPRLPQGSQLSVSELLRSFLDSGHGPIKQMGEELFEVRGFFENHGLLFGEFAKIRMDRLPSVGATGGQERRVQLADDEGILEKNFFLYDPNRNILAFQVDFHASRASRLAVYLSEIAGETVAFDPIVKRDAAERLMRDEVEPLKMDLHFARPTNPELYPDDAWAAGIIEALAPGAPASVHLRLSSDRRSRDPGLHRLGDGVKEMLTAFSRSGLATTAKMTVLEEGQEYPIDLLADRIRSQQDVEMEERGRYPVRRSMHAALQRAYESERESITAVLGEPGAALA